MNTNITEKSSKADIIDASMEYVSWVEVNTFTRPEMLKIAGVALLVGFFAGAIG